MLAFSLSLSLSHTHTHKFIYTYRHIQIKNILTKVHQIFVKLPELFHMYIVTSVSITYDNNKCKAMIS